MKLLSPIQNDNDLVNKKYVDDKVVEVGAPILDVDSLPTITDDNKNKILRYDGKLYYARPVYENKHIEVGDNLSGATLINTWPNEGESIWDLYGSPWLDVSVTAQTYLNFIETDAGKWIQYWRGGATKTQDFVEVYYDQIYLMNGGTVITNEKTIQLSNDFGVVTSVNTSAITTTNPLYNQLFVRVITGYAWCEVSSDVSISTAEPTGNEKIWVDPEEDDIDVEDINIDTNIYIVTGEERKTNIIVDSKIVYVKRINIGSLPNTSSKEIATGVSNVTFFDMRGQIFPPSGNHSPFPYNNPSTGVYGYFNSNNNNIYIYTLSDRSDNTGYIDFYYTKN